MEKKLMMELLEGWGCCCLIGGSWIGKFGNDVLNVLGVVGSLSVLIDEIELMIYGSPWNDPLLESFGVDLYLGMTLGCLIYGPRGGASDGGWSAA
jgi:hypothetical protein